MATFTERTRLLAALLIIVSVVIMSFSVDVCHGSREGAGTFPRSDQADERQGLDPYSLKSLHRIPVRASQRCPSPFLPMPCRPTPRTSSSPSPPPAPPAPEKGEIPPP
uniref:Uncharacterized protein n=1 Tax=Leersia perrieri TaxID=77586 RepID=A0A0D9WRP0_9ORYZ